MKLTANTVTTFWLVYLTAKPAKQKSATYFGVSNSQSLATRHKSKKNIEPAAEKYDSKLKQYRKFPSRFLLTLLATVIFMVMIEFVRLERDFIFIVEFVMALLRLHSHFLGCPNTCIAKLLFSLTCVIQQFRRRRYPVDSVGDSFSRNNRHCARASSIVRLNRSRGTLLQIAMTAYLKTLFCIRSSFSSIMQSSLCKGVEACRVVSVLRLTVR